VDGEWYTGIRVAFLNAPKRDETRITAMEVPTVFKKPGLAGQSDVWIIQKAVYGLTSSLRDWCIKLCPQSLGEDRGRVVKLRGSLKNP
jgi:hypothetical protein